MSSSATVELVEPEIGAHEPERIGKADESVEATGEGEASAAATRTEAVEVGGGLLALVESFS